MMGPVWLWHNASRSNEDLSPLPQTQSSQNKHQQWSQHIYTPVAQSIRHNRTAAGWNKDGLHVMMGSKNYKWQIEEAWGCCAFPISHSERDTGAFAVASTIISLYWIFFFFLSFWFVFPPDLIKSFQRLLLGFITREWHSVMWHPHFY